MHVNNYFEVEWICVGTELSQQTLLQVCERLLLVIDRRKDLLRRAEEILAESQAEHIEIFSAIAKRYERHA